MAKNTSSTTAPNVTNGDEVEEIPAIEDVVVDVPLDAPLDVPDAPDAVAAPAVKRALGVKEPIEFKWKVLGSVPGAVLTLFKAVERMDADSQFERLQKEGYYKDLQVVEATFKVEQPAQPKSAKKAAEKAEKKAAEKVAAKAEAASPVKSRPAAAVPTVHAAKKSAKAPAPPPAPAKKAPPSKPAAKAAAKAAVKPAKKKPAPAKKPAKAK